MAFTQTTLAAEEVPQHLRVPFIKHGYRPLGQPWRYYLQSMFHLHNETLNVWTHLIGCVVIVYECQYYFRFYSDVNSDLRWTVVGFGLCCFTTLFNSATAHLLHSRSTFTNYTVFMFDYIGVVSWGFGTSFLAVYGVSDKEVYQWIGQNYMRWQLLFTYLNYLNICLSKLRYGHDLSNAKRKRLVVGGILLQAFCNFIPWFPRYLVCTEQTDCSLRSLDHISIVVASFTAMTLTFMMHQPEKSCPGKFDLVGQSHQIFHVLVWITMCLQLRALHIDFKNGANVHCKPNLVETLVLIGLLNLAGFVTIYGFQNRIRRKLDKTTDHNSNGFMKEE